jgi:threonine synthase
MVLMTLGDFSLELICHKCGRRYPLDDLIYRCSSCDYPLEVEYDYEAVSDAIDVETISRREWTIWRYKEILPVMKYSSIVSMEEGGAPLHKSRRLAKELGFKNLYLKDETRNPTWSFKDRGSSVGVSKALEMGMKAVGCVSTGNMAASLASYAAIAGMRCLLLVPLKTPLEKVGQMLISGADVVSIDKPYHEINEVGLETSRDYGIFWVHNDAPMRVEGQKTSAFEISEQLGWQTPSKVIIPTSSGGNFSAFWKGFREMQSIGFTEDLPSMVVVQAEGCSPIVEAFKEGRETTTPFKSPDTIVSSIANQSPPSGERVLKIIKESEGLAEASSDDEILEAQALLARTEGLFAEPAGAAPIAVAKKLLENGTLDPGETVVCVITGSGLKDAKSAMKKCGEPSKAMTWGEYRSLVEKILASNK